MTDNEFMLFDRLEKIRSHIQHHGEDKFSISFSGGKDSVVLSALVDEALPGNKIPRVYANTGIEYNEMVKFVKELQAEDDRIVIIKPSVPIKQMLETEGYPFKSKEHSNLVAIYQKTGLKQKYVRVYMGMEVTKRGLTAYRPCPKLLSYQFTDANNLKISDHCCLRMKKEPLGNWSKQHGKTWDITGVMRSEGGRRQNASCVALAKSKNGVNRFNPMVHLTKDWEDWYIAERDIKLCKLYYPPYSFERTGCKGCPFAIDLQRLLDVLAEHFPAERRQCERVWKPVYDEYRRLGYRLRAEDYLQEKINGF